MNAIMRERLTYLALTLTFIAIIICVNPPRIQPYTFILLILAVFRLGRLIAFDKVFAWYRSPFVETVLDDSGAGMTTQPRGLGPRRVIGELVSCPICAGTWAALGLIIGLAYLPTVAYTLMLVMAIAGAIEVFHALTEAMQWTGEAQRKESA
jgi:hypothetical protein